MMLHRLSLLLAVCAAVSTAGCLQSVKHELPVALPAGQIPLRFELAGSFGGVAELANTSSDPWEQRFSEGGFKQIAGLCVTENEVWVCDLEISRVQVFDYDGRFLRSLGAGVPLAGTLPRDEDLYAETKLPSSARSQRWELKQGQRWVGSYARVFKAADVAVTAQGVLFADWAQTSAERSPLRDSSVYLAGSDNQLHFVPSNDIVWPTFLAVDGRYFAFSEPPGNSLMLGEMTDERWPFKIMTQVSVFERILEAQVDYGGTEHGLKSMELAANAESRAGKFNRIGGVAIAFDKLLACDTNNYRIQIFDARRSDPTHWGTLIRVITARKPDGTLRFEAPRDIDVTTDGTVFLLDAARNEVALLNSQFERLGAFGRDELLAPFAMDASPDGRHCFITDRRVNKVWHYAAVD